MKETLLIEFTVENGKNTTISIPDPREDVTKADVITAADEIVAKKAVLSAGNPVPSCRFKAVPENVPDFSGKLKNRVTLSRFL
jgi:hypothetical protein